MDKKLQNYKEKYDSIEIPNELKDAVNKGIKRGRIEMSKGNNKNNNGLYKNLLKVCAGAVIAVGALTAGVNMSPTFADTLKEIPVLGEIVSILEFKDGTGEGGQITDGSDISLLKSFEKDGYDNILIGFSQDGIEQDVAAAFKITYNTNPYAMTVEVGGVRGFSAEKSFDEIKKNKFVKDVYKLITLDDSLVRFVIEFNGPVETKAMELKKPAGIVIGVKEDKEAKEEKVYSLRTKSYNMSERIGSIEEELVYVQGFKDARVLKDNKGLSFVELQAFKSEAEAKAKMNEVRGSGIEVLVEERVGNQSPISHPMSGETQNQMTDSQSSVNVNTDELFGVSITKNGDHIYGNIGVASNGLVVYGEDASKGKLYTISYDSKMSKHTGEASFVLKVKDGKDVYEISGVYGDFFDALAKYKTVK